MRFEQKFKDYRKAFRAFDINFDGQLEFHEFVQGLEFCGIQMPLDDYLQVFNCINYDNTKSIDFNKFCLINIDKSNNVSSMIESMKHNKEMMNEMKQKQEDDMYFNAKKQGNTLITNSASDLLHHRHKLIS